MELFRFRQTELGRLFARARAPGRIGLAAASALREKKERVPSLVAAPHFEPALGANPLSRFLFRLFRLSRLSRQR